MAYTTKQELIDRYGQREILQASDKANSGDINDVAVDEAINEAIADAENEIDSYLAAQYSLPLTVTVPVLVLVASDIARYRLHEKDATDEVAERYASQKQFLVRLAKGGAILIDDAKQPVNSTDQPAASGSPKYCAADRVFTDALLDQY